MNGRVCADVGASTGGFTDCLLQHGAAKVYAIDVGKGILHWKLRTDPRVVVMEETNARYVEVSAGAGQPGDDRCLVYFVEDFAAGGEGMVRPHPVPSPTRRGRRGEGEVIALIKPQFEAGRKEIGQRQGVIRDPVIHKASADGCADLRTGTGLRSAWADRSPVLGPKGNVEFLAFLGMEGEEKTGLAILVEQVLG